MVGLNAVQDIFGEADASSMLFNGDLNLSLDHSEREG